MKVHSYMSAGAIMHFRFILNKYHSVFSPDTFKHDMHIKINTYSVNVVHFYCTFAKSPRNMGNGTKDGQNHFISRPTNSIIYSGEFTLVQLPLQYPIQEERKPQKRALTFLFYTLPSGLKYIPSSEFTGENLDYLFPIILLNFSGFSEGSTTSLKRKKPTQLHRKQNSTSTICSKWNSQLQHQMPQFPPDIWPMVPVISCFTELFWGSPIIYKSPHESEVRWTGGLLLFCSLLHLEWLIRSAPSTKTPSYRTESNSRQQNLELLISASSCPSSRPKQTEVPQ